MDGPTVTAYSTLACRGAGFLLLHIFAKKTDETPAREIATVQRRLFHYLENNL